MKYYIDRENKSHLAQAAGEAPEGHEEVTKAVFDEFCVVSQNELREARLASEQKSQEERTAVLEALAEAAGVEVESLRRALGV